MLKSFLSSVISLAAFIAALSIILNIYRPHLGLANLARRYTHLSTMSTTLPTAASTPTADIAKADQLSRTVLKSVYAVEQAEGVGARVRRSIGSMSLRNLSPFLM
jgi:hypothetical protein